MTRSAVFKICEEFAFVVFCAATIFMLLFSVTAVHKWNSPWNQLSILIACLLPFVLTVTLKAPEWFKAKKLPRDIFIVSIIIILGSLNAVFSDDWQASIKGMGLFIISGVSVFVAARYLINSRLREKIILWLYLSCLIYFGYKGISHFSRGGYIWWFAGAVQQTAGSLIILLSAGPLILISYAKNWWQKSFLIICLLSSISILLINGKKGPLLALAIMLFFVGFFLIKKNFWKYFIVTLLFLGGIIYQIKDNIPEEIKVNFFGTYSIPIRMEYYPLALHVIAKEPIFGKGLYAPLTKYLSDYSGKFYGQSEIISLMPRDVFIDDVERNTSTFANMILCLFAEMGSLLALIYIGFVGHIISVLLQYIKEKPEARLHAIMLLTPLVGFLVHSMTFDSLKYPDLNWIFHSLLGMTASFNMLHDEV